MGCLGAIARHLIKTHGPRVAKGIAKHTREGWNEEDARRVARGEPSRPFPGTPRIQPKGRNAPEGGNSIG